MSDTVAAVPTVAEVAVDPLRRILLRRAPPIATVIINRPAQRNAISFAMWGQLSGVLRELDADPAVRCVVITGAGEEAFSAGADIADFEEYRSDGEKGRAYNRAVDGLLHSGHHCVVRYPAGLSFRKAAADHYDNIFLDFSDGCASFKVLAGEVGGGQRGNFGGQFAYDHSGGAIADVRILGLAYQ